MIDLFNSKTGAIFSDCNKYRYALWRIWDVKRPQCMFIGLNPSTANKTKDDATIRRVKAFASLWGYGGVFMCNCFPFISTDPKELNYLDHLEINNYWLNVVDWYAAEIIFAWGNFSIVKESGRDAELIKMFPEAKCLFKNKNGSPKHPLYVASNIQRIPFIL